MPLLGILAVIPTKYRNPKPYILLHRYLGPFGIVFRLAECQHREVPIGYAKPPACPAFPLKKKYTLNHIGVPFVVEGKFLDSGV